MKMDIILETKSVNEVFRLIQYLSVKNQVDRNYQEIMSRKK